MYGDRYLCNVNSIQQATRGVLFFYLGHSVIVIFRQVRTAIEKFLKETTMVLFIVV